MAYRSDIFIIIYKAVGLKLLALSALTKLLLF